MLNGYRQLKKNQERIIITEFVALKPKTYGYLIDDSDENKKSKVTKKCVIKRKLKIEDHKRCLEATSLENKINQIENNKLNEDSL